MKGLVFSLLEQVVTEAHGEETWDDVLDEAELDGAYATVGLYDDSEFARLLDATGTVLDEPTSDVTRWFGVNAMPLLASAYPGFFDRCADVRSFLLSLNDIIHTEVRKIYPGAEVPEFAFRNEDPDDGPLVMEYRSSRHLCRLAEGFVIGAGRHYDVEPAVSQPRCMLEGDDVCELVIEIG